MDNDDVLIEILKFLWCEDLFKCAQVNTRWNQIANYVLKTMKKDCYFLKWRQNHKKMLVNENTKNKPLVKLRNFNFIQEEGILVEWWGEHKAGSTFDDYYANFRSTYGACVKFSITDEKSPQFIPQQTEMHYLPKSKRIVFHMGRYDGYNNVEYSFDVVFDVSDWCNIKQRIEKIQNVPSNVGGRCQFCCKWNTHQDILPVGTVHIFYGHGRHIFTTPPVMLNTPELLRTIYQDSDLKIFENGVLVKEIKLDSDVIVYVVDPIHIMIESYTYHSREDQFIMNYVTKQKYYFPKQDFLNFFHRSNDVLFFGVNPSGRKCLWKKVEFNGEEWTFTPLTSSGIIPAFCPHERRLLFVC